MKIKFISSLIAISISSLCFAATPMDYLIGEMNIKNGWIFSSKSPNEKMIFANAIGFSKNTSPNTSYIAAMSDQNSNKLNGDFKYVIHFEKNAIPQGAWSISSVDYNFKNKHTLQGNKFVKQADGSVDIYLQKVSAGKEKNWLPIPKDDFMLVMKFENDKNNEWNPPAVKQVS